jgi:hypothetical protein
MIHPILCFTRKQPVYDELFKLNRLVNGALRREKDTPYLFFQHWVKEQLWCVKVHMSILDSV